MNRGWHKLARSVRDRSFRSAPFLQTLVRAGAGRGYVPAALWRRLHPTGSWTLHAPDGTPFVYTSSRHDGLARNIVWTDMRHWEATTQPVLFELARQARVFVDVGAYSGIYVVLACLANPALRAVAFEPNPVKLPQLRRNVAANGLRDRVAVVGKALSSSAGRATLAIPLDDSTASLRAAALGDRTVEVEVTMGDIALAELPVDLIKIDVEGFEAEVLSGMPGVVGRCRPRIIAECLDLRALERLRSATSAFGYRHTYHLGPGGPRPVGDGFVSIPGLPNYLFTTAPLTIGRRSG